MIFDIIFILILVIAAFKGLRKGIILSLFSLAAFIIGIAAALKLSSVVANWLGTHVDSAKWLPVISFIVVFLAVALAVSFFGRFIQKTVEVAMLGWVNRVAGMMLYVILYSIVFSVFVFYADQLKMISDETKASSATYSVIKPIGPIVINAIGDVIPFFKDMFDQLQEFFGGISNKLSH